MNLMFWLFSASLALLLIGYHVYLSFLIIISRKITDPTVAVSYLPSISILVPTYNEGSVIHQKIDNLLRQEYPEDAVEIIFIDGSSDGTKEIISQYAATTGRIQLVNQKERAGKPAALNLGLHSAKNDVIVISDADSILRPNCIRLLIQRLEDPTIGLAGAFTQVIGTGRTGNLEQSYWEIGNTIRVMESRVDSPTSVVASCYAYKRSLIPHFEETILADDMWACLQVRQQGYRVDYLADAIALDYGTPDSIRTDLHHKTRKGFACLQVFNRFKHMVFNSKYGLFGVIILPSHLFRYLVCPYAFFLFIASGIVLMASPYIVPELILILIVLLWSGIIMRGIRSKDARASDPHYSIRGIGQSILMFLLLQIALILAQFAWLTKKYDVRWTRTR
jgi:cellulose synthase/poly-beta-1,6-N-acetylglucosamine synthase-like glycosyltransferase